jgi:hydroxyacylglutathione hydrolase
VKGLITRVALIALAQTIVLAQGRGVQIEGKEVAQNDDVVFRQIDEHTWIGTAHVQLTVVYQNEIAFPRL